MPAELTVASFNIHWGRGRRSQGFPPFDVVEACKQLDADVIALQESWAPNRGVAQHDAVAEALGYEVQAVRSEEHTSELQSLMRLSYAVFCLKKKKKRKKKTDKM